MMSDFYTPSHEITPLTMAVISEHDKNGRTISRVLEEQSEFIVELSPTKVIDSACEFFGVSLQGRQAGTRKVCGITHKAPICIDSACGMYFFPTSSPANANCSWIAHSHINQVGRANDQSTEIIFKSGKRIVVEVSYGSMMNQVHRTAQYRYLLDNRLKYLQTYQADHVAEPFPFGQ